MFVESPVFYALYAVTMLWLGSNWVSMEMRGHFLLTPGFGVGKSMEPAFPAGLIMYIEYYPHHLEKGDIVSYDHPEKKLSVCHRVIDVDGNSVRIKGDNNPWEDGWFDRGVVLGKIWQPFGRPFYIPLSPTAMRRTIEKVFGDE